MTPPREPGHAGKGDAVGSGSWQGGNVTKAIATIALGAAILGIPELGWPARAAKLTERESELLALLPTGMTNRQLGRHLFLSENTIKSQLRSLFGKLDVTNRVQAVALARGDILGPRRERGPDTNGQDPRPPKGSA